MRDHLGLSSIWEFKENSYVASTLAIPIRPAGSAERYFQWSLYLLLVTGFAALAGTGKLDFLSLAVVLPALAVRGYHLVKRRNFALSERWTNYLTIIYFLVYVVDYLMLSQGFVAATVHLVLFIMVVKIFSVQRDRDLVYLAVLSFLMVLAAAVLTVDTLFLLTFGFFLLTAMSTFISMEMRRSERAAQSVGIAAQQERRFNRSLSGVAVLLAFATLAGGTVLFFILPRMSMGGGYLRNFAFQSNFATGFSSEVQLGGIGRIQQSNSVVMHVQVLRGKLPPDPKWRGVALVNFDGRRWWNPDEPPLTQPITGAGLDLSRFRVNTAPMFSTVATPRTTTLSYRVVMEPIGSYIFFVAPAPVKLSGPYDQVSVTQQGTLQFFSEAGKSVGLYYGEADTRDPQPMIQGSNSRAYPPGLELKYLQLPGTLDPRTVALAREITASATSNYERAHAIESYLRKSFGYTLDLPGLRESDPIANFLFERKKGHCEYFASSMAVMLRTLGIPARVVNGFRGGEFNDLNNSYILRSKDAHSWVEVYFPEYGWATFDPTPAVGVGDDSQGGAWARLGLYMDVLRETWREWVVNYDFTHQLKLSYELNSRAHNVQGETRWWFWRKYHAVLSRVRNFQGSVRDMSAQGVVMIGVLLLLVVLLPFAPRAYRNLQYTRMRKDPQRAPKHVASFWYTRMVKLMDSKGVRKSPHQTPSEFAAAIRDPRIRQEVALFTDHYQRARFDESTRDAQLLPGLYQALAGKGR